MIRALIVDDEPLSRRAVRQMCARHADVVTTAECRNGAEAIAALRRVAVDVMFLDVKMPGATGFEIARAGPRTDLPLIVFVTAYAEFAQPAFDAAAIDYLTKPLDPARFDVALQRVRTQLDLLARRAPAAEGPARPGAPTFARELLARSRDVDVLVPTAAIEFIVARDVYAEVHARTGVHLIRQSLDLLERRLDPSRFIRVHRSFIVQVGCAVALRRTTRGGRTIVLRSGAEVRVSRRRKHVLPRLLA